MLALVLVLAFVLVLVLLNASEAAYWRTSLDCGPRSMPCLVHSGPLLTRYPKCAPSPHMYSPSVLVLNTAEGYPSSATSTRLNCNSMLQAHTFSSS